MPSIRVPFTVPYTAQIASPSLAAAIFDQGLDPALDPAWAQSGAASPEEYAYWVERACGVACVKMCVEALGGPTRPLIEWARLGLERGGYLVIDQPDGSRLERGWVHQALADLITSADPDRFTAWPAPAAPEEIVQHLAAGRLVIASASCELGRADAAIGHKGGHLVVITGADLRGGAVEYFYIHNPSGRCPDLQQNACIPIERFIQAYGGRIIAAGLR